VELRIKERLTGVESELESIVATPEAGICAPEGWAFPTALVPDFANLEANRASAEKLASFKDRLNGEAAEALFEDAAMRLTNTILDTWKAFAQMSAPNIFPENEVSRWVTEKAIATSVNPLAGAGFVRLPEDASEGAAEKLILRLTDGEGVSLASWNHLKPAIWRLIKHDFFSTILPMAGLVLLMLVIVFRGIRGVLLSLSTLIVSGIGLLAFMAAIGDEWNLINLAAIPLLLGVSLDYSIHMQLTIRRLNGDYARAQRTLGRALLLCGCSTATGFGSLALSSNAGLASLGVICAAGILITMATAVFLLPGWWKLAHQGSS